MSSIEGLEFNVCESVKIQSYGCAAALHIKAAYPDGTDRMGLFSMLPFSNMGGG